MPPAAFLHSMEPVEEPVHHLLGSAHRKWLCSDKTQGYSAAFSRHWRATSVWQRTSSHCARSGRKVVHCWQCVANGRLVSSSTCYVGVPVLIDDECPRWVSPVEEVSTEPGRAYWHLHTYFMRTRGKMRWERFHWHCHPWLVCFWHGVEQVMWRLVVSGLYVEPEHEYFCSILLRRNATSLKEFTTPKAVKQVCELGTTMTQPWSYAQMQRSALVRDSRQTWRYWCGSLQHLTNTASCKVRDRHCLRCNKIGNFQTVCCAAKCERVWKKYAKREREVSCSYTLRLALCAVVFSWNYMLRVWMCGFCIVGTGSSVPIITKGIYMKQLKAAAALPLPSVTLLHYSSSREIAVKGCSLVNVFYQQQSTCVLFYVV